MTMTDEEKALAAERRAEERLVASLEREHKYQATLREEDFQPESWRAIEYLNRQLLLRHRQPEWKSLKETRDIHLRQGALRRR